MTLMTSSRELSLLVLRCYDASISCTTRPFQKPKTEMDLVFNWPSHNCNMSALLVLPYDPNLHRTLNEPHFQLDRLKSVDYPTIIDKLRALLESHELKDTVGFE